jgi:hypothetical protein
VDQTVELFCGERKAFSAIGRALGYSAFTVNINPAFEPDLVADIRTVDLNKLPKKPLMVWAAPPDAGFAREHWTGIDPADQEREAAMALFRMTMRALYEMDPTWWFIENPKGPLRSLPVLAGFNRGYPSRNRHTIRHDEFGGRGGEETDVWTNAYWWIPRPGERTGEGSVETGRRVPPLVFAEIFSQLDAYRSTGSYGPR